MPIALIFHDDECVPARDIPSTEELEKAWNEYVESEAGYPKFKYPDKKVLKRPRFNFQDVRVDPQAKGELEDLSDEEHRTYVYEDGELTLQEPVALRLGGCGSHYVVTSNGHVTYVPPGWRYFTWLPKDGESHFS